MHEPVEVRWGPRARLVGVIFAAALTTLAAWAWLDPRRSTASAIFAATIALGGLALVIELFVLRVVVDEHGLTRRSLLGGGSVAWPQIRAATLVATAREGGTIVHRRTDDPEEAVHLLLRADSPARRRWDFNQWMDGFDGVVAAARERELVARPWPAPATPRLDRALSRLHNTASLVYAGFAAVFFLLVASAGVIVAADIILTGDLLVDLGLVAVALLAAIAGLSWALRALGARRFAGAEAPISRYNWLMDAACLLGGGLFLAWFVPRGLAGGDALDWLLAALGGLLLATVIRDWLRGG